MMGNTEQYLDWARRVLRTEALGLNEIADALDGGFVRAADALLHCKGRVVITGMGKSGHVGRKIAATMASTGTPAFFVHPAEAAHGDLGMIVDNDVVVAISNSGESDEITAIMPALKRKNVTLIGITARPASTLARHADIALPATTSYERNDIEQMGDYAQSHIVAMKKIVEPVFEARSDFDIFAAIAKRLGKGEEFTAGLTEMEWIRNLYEAAKIESRAKGMEMPVFDVFWKSNRPLAFPISAEAKDFVRHADFRADPLLNALGTASGKFELYSRTIEKYGYDDCPPHATWMEPLERTGRSDSRYPLHIVSNHPQMRLHSQLCGTINRNSYEVAGREPCWMNPQDAKARGLKDGDVVRVFNQRGQILAGLKVTDEIMPGAIRINEGGWYDPVNSRDPNTLCAWGDVNVLTTGVATSKLAQGNCGHTAVAEVERFRGSLPPVMVFSQPKARG